MHRRKNECVYVCVRHRDGSNDCHCKIDIILEEITHRQSCKNHRLERYPISTIILTDDQTYLFFFCSSKIK